MLKSHGNPEAQIHCLVNGPTNGVVRLLFPLLVCHFPRDSENAWMTHSVWAAHEGRCAELDFPAIPVLRADLTHGAILIISGSIGRRDHFTPLSALN